MFIQTEATPNPATLKFLPGRAVLDAGTLDMPNRQAAGQSPLAERLFDIPNIAGVFFGSDFISVTKTEGEWQQIRSDPRRHHGTLFVGRTAAGNQCAAGRGRGG